MSTEKNKTQYPLIKPRYYFHLAKQVLAFIKEPHFRRDNEKSTKLKVYDTIGLFILKMVLLIPVLIFFALVYDPENVQSQNMAERFSPIVLLLVGGLILPLIEEIAFRLSLKFHPAYLALTSSALIYYLLTKAVFQTKISLVDESFPYRVSIAVSCGFLLFFIVKNKAIHKKLAGFWASNFKAIYYISCLVFAWIHITKYELTWLNILLLPILTLPQLLSAIIYGYTRVAFGFKYPLILHIAMNSVAISVSLLA